MTRAQQARAHYEATMNAIRAELPSSSREFAQRASAACLKYEAAMTDDIGATAARAMGAGLPRLA